MRFHWVRLALVVLTAASFVGCGSKSASSGGGQTTLSSISVSAANSALDITTSEQFSATGHYSDGSTQDLTSTVTWSSSSGSVASISASGMAAALAAGSTKITATSGSVSGSETLQVNGPVSIALTPIGPAISVGSAVQLKATGSFADNAVIDLTSVASWSSNPSAIAGTSSTGSVTGTAPGVATITATSGTIIGSTAVNVTAQSTQNPGNGSLPATSSYAFFLTTIDSRGQAVIVGSFTTDGNGNIVSGIADYNTAAGVSNSGPVSLSGSTYNVWPDGRGEATIGLANGMSFHLALVLSEFNSGVASKGNMISFDNNKAFGYFELQTPGADLSSTYVFAFSGLDASNNQEAQIGEFETSGTGVYDVNDNGSIDGGASGANPPPATGQTLSPVVLGSVSTGNRGTATLGAANYAYYTVNANRAYFVETDAAAGSTSLSGVAVSQTTVQPLAAENPVSPCDSLGDESTCNYAVLLNHAATVQNGTFERAAQLNFCPCNQVGGIAFAHEDDHDGSSWTISGGTRPFDSVGRGLIQYTVFNAQNPTVGLQRYEIAYTVSRTPSEITTQASSQLYMMNTDTASPGIGTADFIDVNLLRGPMPAAGNYVFYVGDIGDANLLQLGQVSFTNANATGVNYVNNNGALSAVAVSGSFTAPTDGTSANGGDGRGTITPFNSTTSSLTAYNVGAKGLIVLNSAAHISGRLEPQ